MSDKKYDLSNFTIHTIQPYQKAFLKTIRAMSGKKYEILEATIESKDLQIKTLEEALEYIAPMESDEDFPATRISKAAKRAREALAELKKMRGGK
ncbi:MAG TPA: hypothetical protein VFW58_11380 [Trichococcus sp.]|nr:hypothetical protein [Trichococcus sp.]